MSSLAEITSFALIITPGVVVNVLDVMSNSYFVPMINLSDDKSPFTGRPAVIML